MPGPIERQAEADAREAFRREGLSPHSWSNGPAYRYATHTHSYQKVLFCVEGSITFHTPQHEYHLRAGDRLDLDRGVPHSATVGPEGVTCLEAAR